MFTARYGLGLKIKRYALRIWRVNVGIERIQGVTGGRDKTSGECFLC